MLETIERGWLQVKEGAIDKIQGYLKTGDSEVMFSREEYIRYYS